MRSGLTTLGLIVSITVGVIGCFQAWAVLPYRVEENSKAIKVLQDEAKTNREILIRIEERLIRVLKETGK